MAIDDPADRVRRPVEHVEMVVLCGAKPQWDVYGIVDAVSEVVEVNLSGRPSDDLEIYLVVRIVELFTSVGEERGYRSRSRRGAEHSFVAAVPIVAELLEFAA